MKYERRVEYEMSNGAEMGEAEGAANSFELIVSGTSTAPPQYVVQLSQNGSGGL